MAGDNESRGQQYNFDTGDLLESSEGWWKARGRAAETAANDLHALIEQVDPIFRKTTGATAWKDAPPTSCSAES